MITLEEYRVLALSLPDTVELPHFDNPFFRVKKKIFATY
ncbi:MAG: MmcQ/YjbR family DNA-binding protein [Sphingobacterium sp.]|nr:MmcQ/YjbR family DNA-binding protein [Sphingobacterium sp.]